MLGSGDTMTSSTANTAILNNLDKGNGNVAANPVNEGERLAEIEKGFASQPIHVYFEVDDETISFSEENEKRLDDLKFYLKKVPSAFVEVSGHTDNYGERNYNMRLSKKRAERIASFLEGQGIDHKSLQTVGYGPDKPLASNDSRTNRYLNRRVEIQLLK